MLAKIAAMPALQPTVWCGMPGYAKDRKTVCFFRADKKYMTFGFTQKADLTREEGAPGPEEKATREAWVSDFQKAIQQNDSGAYVNFLADVDAAQVRAAYPRSTWDRLRQIKAKYDPIQSVPYEPEHPECIKEETHDPGIHRNSRRARKQS